MKTKKEIEEQLAKWKAAKGTGVFRNWDNNNWDNPQPAFALNVGYILALEWVLDQEKP